MEDNEKDSSPRVIYGSGCSCGSGLVSTKEIKIDDRKVEIKGLKETFKAYENIIDPKKSEGDRIISALKEVNDIPEEEEKEYKKAILKKFEKYCETKTF